MSIYLVLHFYNTIIALEFKELFLTFVKATIMNEKFKHFMRFGHIPLLIFLQVVFIILFATFVDYDPKSVVPHGSIYAKKFKFDKSLTSSKEDQKQAFADDYQKAAEDAYSGYPCK